MFPFVVLKVLFQIPIIIPWCTQLSIITSKNYFLIFTAFYISNLLRVAFVSNISYLITTIWNYRSINNLSIFSLDMIILFFKSSVMLLPITLISKVRNILHLMTACSYLHWSTIIFLEISFISYHAILEIGRASCIAW